MPNTLDRLYYDYYQLRDDSQGERGEYENARQFAVELLEKLITEKAIADPVAADRIVGMAMADAKHLGFVEGFRYAVQLLALNL